MTQKKKMIPISLYVIMVLLGSILWIIVPELGQFIGASSLWDAIVFFASADNRLGAIFALIWIPVFIVGITISYILIYKQQKIVPFLVFAGGDLLISSLFIVYKVCINNHTDLFVMLTGLLVRTLYYMWMVLFLRRAFRMGEGSRT